MDDRRLFALIKAGQEFSTAKELRVFLETIFNKDLIFPAVQASELAIESQWTIQRLSPLYKNDSLTVENYLQGLREFEKQEIQEKYTGRVITQTFESFRYPSQNKPLMFARLIQTETKGLQRPERFLLTISMDEKETPGGGRRVIGYTAKSDVVRTELGALASRFIGPNQG